jgi:hypothetical protein
MVRENCGSNVMATRPREPKNKKGAEFLMALSGNIRPMHRAMSPMPSPASWRFTKKRDDPNVSSAYTELDEYTNKHPIRMSVATIVRKTLRSAYKGNFFEIIFSYSFLLQHCVTNSLK